HAGGACSSRKRRTVVRSSSWSSESSKSMFDFGRLQAARNPTRASGSGRYRGTVTRMRLRYAEADEAFRRELLEWLDEHPPPAPEVVVTRRSSADLSDWARTWQ